MTAGRMHRQGISSTLPPDQLAILLEHTEFRRMPFATVETTRLVDVCRLLFGRGNAVLAVFEIEGGAAAFPELLEADEYGRFSIVDVLLQSEGFARALPEVALARGRPPVFKELSPVLLDGHLAQLVWEGGPRTSFPGTGADAKTIGTRFCSAVFGNRYEDVRVEHSTAQWSSWFKGVAWDHTFVVVDVRRRVLTTLCLTDGDDDPA